MKARLVRLSLAAGLLGGLAAPATQAHAWACLDDVGRAVCFVVGTACSATPDKDIKNINPRDLCTFG